jgi:hypothetical protein
MAILAMGRWQAQIRDHWHKAGISDEGSSMAGSNPNA